MADTPKKEGILQKLPPIIPPVISDFVKDQYNKEGIFRTVSKPYVDVYKGMTDPEYRYDNFPKTYEEYIDKIVVNEDGINRATGKDRDYYLNHEPTYNNFIKQKNMRANPALAKKLSGESGLARAGRGIINAGADAALLAAILPGETFTMENIGRLRQDYVVDEEMAAKYNMTVDEANAFIRKHDDMANLGYFGAVGASLPIEDILFRAAGSGLIKGGKSLLGINKKNVFGPPMPFNQPTIVNLQNTGVNVLNKTEKGFVPTKDVNKYIEDNYNSFLDFNKKFKLTKTDINAKRKFINYQNNKLNFFKKHIDNPNTEKVWNKIESRFFNTDVRTASKNRRGITQPRDYDSRPILGGQASVKLGDEYLAMGNNPINFDTGKPITIDEWFDPPSSINKIGGSPNKRRQKLKYGADFVQANRRAVRNQTKPSQGDAWAMSQANKQLQWMRNYENKTGLKKYKEIKDPTTNSFRGIQDLETNELWLKDGLTPVNNPNSNIIEKKIREHPHFKNIQFFHEGVQDIKHATLTPSITKDFLEEFDDIFVTAMGKEGNKFNFNMFANYVDLVSQGKNPATYNARTFKNSYVEMHHTKGLTGEPLNPLMIQNTSKFANLEADRILARFNNNIDNGVDIQKALTQVKEEMAEYPTLRLNIPVGEKFIQVGKNLNPKETSKILKEDIIKKYNTLKETNPNLVKEMGDFFGLGKKTPAKKLDGNAMGGIPISRTFYKNGDQDPDDPASDIYTGASFGFGSIKEVQDDIKRIYEDSGLSNTIEDINKSALEPVEIKAADVLSETRKIMNKGDRPLEFRPLADGYELLTDNPIFETLVASPWVIYNTAKDITTGMINAVTGSNIDPRKDYPASYEIQESIMSGAGKTPDDQTYISFVDEINRAQEKGIANLSFSLMDIASLIPDIAFDAGMGDKIKETYNKAVDSGELYSDPETFLGDMGSILVEFGAPAGAVTKTVNGARRMLKSYTGLNLFTAGSYGTSRALGASRAAAAGVVGGNVAKRVGVGATIFAGTDLIAGGPYNSVTEMIPDDPLFFDNTLGYDYEDTEGLSGRELAIANLKNRLRFGADGAIIGGLFPLVGPPLWLATKYGVGKPAMYVAGKGARVVDNVAIRPISYLSANVPGVKTIGQGIGGGAKIFGEFLGKDILARAAAVGVSAGSAALKSTRDAIKYGEFSTLDDIAQPGLIKQLPDYKDWRLFEVTSDDAVEASLKKIDNVLSLFRDVGKKTGNQFYVETKAQQKIKGLAKKTTKYIDAIEQRAYNLAKGFETRYNGKYTSPAGEEYILEQVLSALKGQVKINDLPKELQPLVKDLDELLDTVKLDYAGILPDSGFKDFLTNNLKTYLRQSFATFTNPQYRPTQVAYDNAVDFVSKMVRDNENILEAARLGSPGRNTSDAVNIYAAKVVDDILLVGKTDGKDPLMQLAHIAKRKLQDEELAASIKTGEELPDVIKQLLGEENNLRSSVLQTVTSLATQTGNLKAYDRIADILLQEGRLFESPEIAQNFVKGAIQVNRVPGIGLLDSKINYLWGSPEVVLPLQGSQGYLDKLAQNSIIQMMLAYKAGVQTTKTVLSPATQSRNVGSAAAFVLNNGWIGGRASVQDSFKIVMDDIFGAGKLANEEDLIKYIGRQTELGVVDENIVASELTAMLNDLKQSEKTTFMGIVDKFSDRPLLKKATEVYAGGDNLWKIYAHEYLKSMFKGAFKDIDEVKRNVKIDFGIDEFNPQTMAEAVEEYSALLVRELMPTYSKVPPAIQAIRKIPVIGNFVSFPAEILRTSVATTSLALKHIASDNAVLRQMGHRSLMGQAATLYGLNEGVRGLAHMMTDVTPEMITAYKDYFGPEYMQYSDLVPISKQDKNGVFKVFDMSRYNPYDIVSATAQNFMRRVNNPKAKIDPEKIDNDVIKEYVNAFGPVADLVSGTFFGIAISGEAAMEAITGNKKAGGRVWSESDKTLEKWDKSVMHWANKVEPGAVSTAQKLYGAVKGDVDSQGVPLDISDEIFKLSGGSTVSVNVPASFSYKISEFQNTFKDALVSESFYSTKDYQSRGPAQLVREYNQFNEEAFREQFEFYKAAKAAINTGLMTRSQVRKALKNRKISNKTINNILQGKFTPLSTREGGLEARYKKIKEGNPGKYFSKLDFIPKGALDRAKRNWARQRFEEYEYEPTQYQSTEPESESDIPTINIDPSKEEMSQAPTPLLPESSPVQVAATQPATGVVNQATGLTNTESALLNRDEQLIRQRQRGTV